MSLLLLLIALAGFVCVGLGVSLLRVNSRPPLAGSYAAIVRGWFATLRQQRAVGAGLVAGGAVVILLVLVLRP